MSGNYKVSRCNSPHSLDARIEQCIALGYSHDRIRCELHTTAERVAAVWQAMEEAVYEPKEQQA